jgi:hypothetical protein
VGRRNVFIVGVVVGALAGGAAVAVAAIPDTTTGVITSCLKVKDGSVRIIDAQAGKRCSREETLLAWNKQGPEGPAGASAHNLGLSASTRLEIASNGAWQPIVDAALSIPSASFAQSASITFWSSSACFGLGSKYARIVVNGAPGPSAPIAPVPSGDFSELQASIVLPLQIAALQSAAVTVEIQTAPSSYCVWTPGQWSLTATSAQA